MAFRLINKGRVRAAVLALIGMGAAQASAVVIGPTYPISEPDVLSVIKQRAAALDWKHYLETHPQQFKGTESVNVARATRTQGRTFDPTYAIPADILDRDGKVLYAVGTRVNVLDRVHLPGRYIVISADDYDWLRDVGKPQPGDKVLLADGSALAERLRTHWPLYQLSARFVDRFGIQAIPCIVQQRGTLLQINEYKVEHHG